MNLALLSLAPFIGYFVSYWSAFIINLCLYALNIGRVNIILLLGLVCLFQDPYFSLHGVPLWYAVTVIYLTSRYYKHWDHHRKDRITNLAILISIFTLSHAVLSVNTFGSFEFAIRLVLIVYLLPNILWYEMKMMNSYTIFQISRSLNYLLLGACFCGFFQTISFFTSFGEPLIPYSIRPTAFTSEATWFGLIGLLGIINLHNDKNVLKKFYLFVYIIAILISESRNAYIGLALYTILFNWRILPYLILAMLTTYFLVSEAMDMSSIIDRFKLADSSSVGRFVAYSDSFTLIWSNAIGTGWDYSYSDGAQPTVGAKSFNFFLHFFHVYGWIGIIPMSVLLVLY